MRCVFRLLRVTDAAGGNYVEDIKSQSTPINYEYDAIGNLVRDRDEQNDLYSITWNVYGKIKEIHNENGSSIYYTYDAAGNRIEKIFTDGSSEDFAYTWYVRDAQGNVMAVYEKRGPAGVRLTETHLYGSSRLGMAKELTKQPVPVNGPANAKVYTFTRGEKFFETNLMQLIYIQC